MCSCGLYIILKLRHNQLKVPCSEFEDAGNVLISCWNKHKEALDGMYSVIMNLKPAVEAFMLLKKKTLIYSLYSSPPSSPRLYIESVSNYPPTKDRLLWEV